MSSQAQIMELETRTNGPRRANEMLKGRKEKAPEPLFDTFWRDGELALMFGEPGAGKSVLAVQIADSLARGERLLSPNGARKKTHKVLYIDLVLSDRQFRERYAGTRTSLSAMRQDSSLKGTADVDPAIATVAVGRPLRTGISVFQNERTGMSAFRFSRDLYRDIPPEGEDLFEWIAAMVARHGFTAVIIDDLSLVSRTEDGTRHALGLMHHLRQLTVETGVSILVLADAYPFVYEKHSPERGLRRSRVLCGAADSVFALHDGFIIQTRSRSAQMAWTTENAIRYRIDELESGMLGMEFSLPEMNETRRELVLKIKRLHDEDKMTFREIASELDLTKSTAQRLYSEWKPELEMTGTEENDEDLDPDAMIVDDVFGRCTNAQAKTWRDYWWKKIDHDAHCQRGATPPDLGDPPPGYPGPFAWWGDADELPDAFAKT